MNDLRQQKQLELRRESLKKRLPLVAIIVVCFIIYNFVAAYEILKWASLAVLIVYIVIGMHYRKKIRTELDKIPYKTKEEDQEIDNSTE